jgi:hypothetical protein
VASPWSNYSSGNFGQLARSRIGGTCAVMSSKFRDVTGRVPPANKRARRPVGPTGETPVLLFRGCEGVFLGGGLGERFVVGHEINRVDAVAFGVAVKKIAFA